MTDDRAIDRRTVLAGAGAVAGAALLAACNDGKDTSSSGPGSGAASNAPAGGASGGSGAGGSQGSGGSGAALVKLSEVPVGGAVSAKTPDGKPAIVAQPAKGQVVAFSAICTHQGCTVAPGDKILQCPCHGSQYDPATGKVVRGPAPRALSPIQVRVQGDEVVTG